MKLPALLITKRLVPNSTSSMHQTFFFAASFPAACTASLPSGSVTKSVPPKDMTYGLPQSTLASADLTHTSGVGSMT